MDKYVLIRPNWEQLWRHLGMYLYQKNDKKPIYFGYATEKHYKKDKLENSNKLVMVAKSEMRTGYDVLVWDIEDVKVGKEYSYDGKHYRKFKPRQVTKELYGDYNKHPIWFNIKNPKFRNDAKKFLEKLIKNEKVLRLGHNPKYEAGTDIYQRLNKDDHLLRFALVQKKVAFKEVHGRTRKVIEKFEGYFKENSQNFLSEYEIQGELFRKLAKEFEKEIDNNSLFVLMESMEELKKLKDKSQNKKRKRFDIDILDASEIPIVVVEIKFGTSSEFSKIKDAIKHDVKAVKKDVKKHKHRGFVLFYSNKVFLTRDERLKLQELSKNQVVVKAVCCSLKKVKQIIMAYDR